MRMSLLLTLLFVVCHCDALPALKIDSARSLTQHKLVCGCPKYPTQSKHMAGTAGISALSETHQMTHRFNR